MYNNRNTRGHNYYRLRGRYLCDDLYSKNLTSNKKSLPKYYDIDNTSTPLPFSHLDDFSKLSIKELYELLKELKYFDDFNQGNYN